MGVRKLSVALNEQVADAAAASAERHGLSLSALLAADLSTGTRSVLSANGTPDSSNRFSNVHGLALDYGNNRVLLADSAHLFAIDLTSGARTVLSERAPPNHINSIGVTNIAYDPATKVVYVVDSSFSAVTAIDTVTGRRVYMLK